MTKVSEPIQTPPPARMRKPSKGQRVGYLRVSSLDQNEVRQLEGLALDKIFADKASGKDVNRPQLEAMQSFVREGDTVFCHSMDRLARNLDDLRRIVLSLTERGIHIVFVKENLTFTGEDSPMSNLLLSVMGAFAQFERELIRERQREGIAIAKREGKYSGRKPSLTPARAAELRRRVGEGDSKAALAREFGISRDTLYRYVPVKKHRTGKLAKR
jgi:DNA invertase Pin-like site-specific DNA recombinase